MNDPIRKALTLCLALVFGTWAGVALSADEEPKEEIKPDVLPEVMVPQLASTPVVDGMLDDACWETAEAIALGRILFKSGPVPVATEATLGHTDGHLFLGVRCHDTPGAEIRAEEKGKACDAVVRDDSIELFLQPPGSPGYYHFLLGAGNAKRAQYVRGASRRQQALPWPSATRVHDSGWSAELAIPLFLLGRRRIEDGVIRFNIARNKRTEPPAYITWAPVGARHQSLGYHDPERFGCLSGLSGVTVPPVFAPAIVEAGDVSPFERGKHGTRYAFDVTVSNPGGLAGTAELLVEDKPAGGRPVRLARKVNLPATGKRTVSVHVPVDMPVDRIVSVMLASDLDAPDAWWVDVEGTERLKALVAYPNLSMYSGEREGRFTIGTAFPDAEFARRRMAIDLNVTAPDGKEMLTRRLSTTRQQGARIPMPVGDWQPGRYSVGMQLQDAEGDVVAIRHSEIRVVPPPPDGVRVSKIDHERMCLLVDGEPFFPFGFMSQPGFGEDLDGIDVVERQKRAGFNHIVDWNDPGANRGYRNLEWTEESDRWLGDILDNYGAGYRRAAEVDIPVFPPTVGFLSIGHSNLKINRRDHKIVMEHLPRVVKTLWNNPGLVGWKGVDEPIHEILPLMKEHAALIRELDPYHVIYSSCTGLAPEFLDAYDVLGVHDYWGPSGTPNYLSSEVLGGYHAAKTARCPIFATPQAQRLNYHRELTPAERRAGLYLCLINGAKGIQLFTYPDRYKYVNDITWRVLGYTAREVAILAPVLLREPPPQNVVCTLHRGTSGATALPELPPARTLYDPPSLVGGRDMYGLCKGPGPAHMPVIQALVHDAPFEDAQGGPAEGELILAANSSSERFEIEYALSSLGPDSQVRQPVTGFVHPVKNDRFTDVLEPYATRIYHVTGSTRKPGAPVSLGIAVQAPPAPILRKPDLAENGGFEEGEFTHQSASVGHLGKWLILGPADNVTRVENDVHSGQRALKLLLEPDVQIAVKQPIELRPGNEYRASMWVKQDVTEARQQPSFFVHPEPREACTGHVQCHAASGDGRDTGWQEYTCRFRTRDTLESATLYILAVKGTRGTILVDDVRVEDMSAARQQYVEVKDRRVNMPGYERKIDPRIYSAADDLAQMLKDPPPEPGENILRNSSFEAYTVPDLIDCWVGIDYHRSYFGMAIEHVYDGEYSVRLRGSLRPNFRYVTWTSWESGTDYVFSIYAKADEPGRTLRVALQPYSGRLEKPLVREFEVGTEWTRLVWTFRIPPDIKGVTALTLAIQNVDPRGGPTNGFTDALVWIDAAQLELGMHPTPYQRDGYQPVPIDRKWMSDDVFDELKALGDSTFK